MNSYTTSAKELYSPPDTCLISSFIRSLSSDPKLQPADPAAATGPPRISNLPATPSKRPPRPVAAPPNTPPSPAPIRPVDKLPPESLAAFSRL